MGTLVGDCFAMGFLVTITSGLSNEEAFMVTALILVLLVLPLLFIVAEPILNLTE
jgi:ABC-type phosphate transport system permease subunit